MGADRAGAEVGGWHDRMLARRRDAAPCGPGECTFADFAARRDRIATRSRWGPDLGQFCALAAVAKWVPNGNVAGGAHMNLDWIMLGLVGWALALFVGLTFMRMTGKADRAARHAEKRLDPFSDVTITRTGSG